MQYQFKHKSEADSLQDECTCPPDEATELGEKVVVYRFVFEECDEDSFVPQGVSRPSEISSKPCAKRCEYLSLSFYQEKKSAEQAYAFFKKHFKGFVERSGNCLAKGHLEPGDGLILGPRDDSHIELFEDENVQLAPRFAVIQAF